MLRYNLVLRSSRCHPSARFVAAQSFSVPTSPSPSAASESQTRDKSNGKTEAKIIPALQSVPSLPFIGSLAHPSNPKFAPHEIYDFYPEMRRRFGDWYTIGFPGLGNGIFGTVYVMTDPEEMRKVLRQERGTGPYPRGIVEAEWPLKKYFGDINSPLGVGENDAEDKFGFLGRGETWKRLRTFLQTDMLSPQAATGYIPGIIKAAELASKGAPGARNSLNTYTNHCAFDMFCSMMFGELTRVADPNTKTDPDNAKFCDAAVTALEKMIIQMTSPMQMVLFNLGITTSTYKEMESEMAHTREIGLKKYESFLWRMKEGRINSNEEQSYLARAISRQASEGSNISESEVAELSIMALTAAIDTTSSLLNWNLLHLAFNERVQEKLHKELVDATNSDNGKISADALSRSASPYLHAMIRETHRMTPPVPVSMYKENRLYNIEINGTTVPKDSVLSLDSFSIGVDPDYVDDPQEFRPERWLPEAVEMRKGTQSEILDHPLYRDPFSQGSRKCPGSRVASNEVLALLSQLVLDWKISAPPHLKTFKDVRYGLSGMVQPEMPGLEFTERRQ